MSVGPRIALLAALAVALLALAVPGQAATGVGAVHPQVADEEQTNGPETNLTMVVEVRSNGDARWTVSTTFNLTSPAEREAFRETAAAFEDGETSALGVTAYRRASTLASEATGREMTITDVRRRVSPETEIENGTGRLAVEFTWTNFSYAEGNRLYVDDVFETTRGTWLSGLERGDTLIIRAPDGYGVVDASVAPENRSLRWSGPATFNASSLRAVFTGRGAEPTPTGTPTGTPNGPTTEESVPWAFLFTIGLGGGLVAVYLLARHRDGFELPAGGTAESDPAEAPPHPDDVAPTPDPDAAAAETGDGDDPDIDEELLSDEERVERLLERNGGRMKQADIVKATGWSNAKVSQLLSAMEDDDRIDKLRIGRENLISFPDVDVTDIDE